LPRRDPRIIAYRTLLAFGGFAGVSVAASAQSPSRADVEIGYVQSRLTAGYPAWHETYARGVLSVGANTWRAEATRRDAFGDMGVFFGTSLSRVLGRRWYASAASGTSAGGFFFPRLHAGGMVARKWLDREQLVTTSGLSVYAQKDAHRDLLWTTSVIYYFTSRPSAVLETGLTLNRSTPGPVLSTNRFVAATIGNPARRSVAGRFMFGREAYQRLDAARTLVGFPSRLLSLSWREPLTSGLHVIAGVEHYTNSVYSRTGISIGLSTGKTLGSGPTREAIDSTQR
jgi:YaiO family outer membrane protein